VYNCPDELSKVLSGSNMHNNQKFLSGFDGIRPRRLRLNTTIRNLCSENTLQKKHLISPLFIQDSVKGKIEINSMPGCFRHDIDSLLREIEESMHLGINIFALFPVIKNELKCPNGTEALNQDSLIPQTLQKIKEKFPGTVLIADLALDPYTSHGQDGVLDENNYVDNDRTVKILSEMAIVHAQAGADILAPSDMMDRRVQAIRKNLDQNNLINKLILSYSAKYASAFYGPFRDALISGLKSGDKKTYQMDFSNSKEAIKEAKLDEEEGADMLMVKPALSYLDVIYQVSQNTKLPILAYSVSGEYSMIKAAALNGWLDEKQIVLEILTSVIRAGASGILTYHAKQAAQWF